MKKSIREGSMSDVDLMAQDAKSFKEFVKEFYKEFRDFPKNREAMKWLEDTYKSVSESVESDELERVADGLPQTVEETINEISLSSAGVRDFLRALYRNNNIVKKLGFANFKGVVDYIKGSGGRDWDELRDEATAFGLRFESINEAFREGTASHFNAELTKWAKKYNLKFDYKFKEKGKKSIPYFIIHTDVDDMDNKQTIELNKLTRLFHVDYRPIGKTLVVESVNESLNPTDIVKDLDKVKNDLLKKVDVLISKKKKLYSNVDIESPMSADEKKLNKDIADLFSQINTLVLQKRTLKAESVNEGAGCGCGCGCGGSTLKENTEPSIISQLKDIVKHNQSKVLVDPKSGKKMRVDLYSASAITQVYDALKQQSNRDKFVGSGLIGMQSMAMKLLK